MKNTKKNIIKISDPLFFDVVVCGGGLSGLIAAVASARNGAKTCLIQDRPVFGGNSSSEIRITPHGAAAFHCYGRETGIISELLIEERHRNHETIIENGWTNSIWDMVLYDMAVSTPNLKFFLNTQALDIKLANPHKIAAIKVRVSNAEKEFWVNGKVFIDCTGDGVIGFLAGCEWRMGTEGFEEFSELHAPPKASNDTMGTSIQFRARNIGKPIPFRGPEWAVKFEDPNFFYKRGRIPKVLEGGYWWIELGVPWDTIHDNEEIRHELTRYVLGIWDWIKNKDPELKEKATNYALDWVGQVPGKRESRRIMGLYLMNENDISPDFRFPDEIAYGGWFIDIHTPGGLLAEDSEATSLVNYDPKAAASVRSYIAPYGIPLRSLIAKEVDNLLLAGRDISVTHAVLSSLRVMGTGSVLGQAAGTTAAISVEKNVPLHDLQQLEIKEIQQRLLRAGCFLPHIKNEDPLDFSQKAKAIASSEAKLSGSSLQEIKEQNPIGLWLDQPQGPWDEYLHTRVGQIIPINSEKIDQLSVCLSNHSEQIEEVRAEIYSINSIWDYRSIPGVPISAITLRVPPGVKQWIDWKFDNGLFVEHRSLIRLDLLRNENIEWHKAGSIESGCMAMFETAPGKMRRYQQGTTLCFKIEPIQLCYGPQNVINGITRPYDYPNLWKSDPQSPLSQWLELDWESEQSISSIEITFDGNILREYHAYPPMFEDPLCVRDYQIEIWDQSEWQIALRITGNYQRRRVHKFERQLITKRLRLKILATNGDKFAAIYEIRCY